MRLKAKDKIDSQDEAQCRCNMIPMYMHVESEDGENHKDNQGNDLLYYLELHEIKRATIATEANPVSRYLKAIFEKSHSPREQNNSKKRPLLKPREFTQFEM